MRSDLLLVLLPRIVPQGGIIVIEPHEERHRHLLGHGMVKKRAGLYDGLIAAMGLWPDAPGDKSLVQFRQLELARRRFDASPPIPNPPSFTGGRRICIHLCLSLCIHLYLPSI
ncbi:MAG: hypothetical protein ACKV19_04605 [Verrucomicrobiales bacterium]